MTDFIPPRLIRGPLLQSFLANIGPRRNRVISAAASMLRQSQDMIAECGNGVRLLIHHESPRVSANARIIVLIHGWEGSGNSTYLLSAATQLWIAGYRIIRLNLRDHGESHHLNRDMFHSCRLAEVIGAVRWIQDAFCDAPISLVGFSLGGNFAMRIAASSPREKLHIQKVIAVCPVLDPRQTMDALDTGWPGYRYFFIRKWRISLEKKKLAFPNVYDFTDLSRFKTLRSMTDYFVQRYTEFPDLDSYLNGYSLAGRFLSGLEVPATMLMANDDPVIPIIGLEQIARPSCLTIERSEFGGHCGFVAGYKLHSWLDKFILEELASNA